MLSESIVERNIVHQKRDLKKLCKTSACYCLGILTFTGCCALSFYAGHIYKDNDCNTTTFL